MTPGGTFETIVLDSVDSTMSEAACRAPLVAGPTWIMAHTQTAARGRRGRPWQMPAGNFAATLILPVTEPPATVALRSFVAALALRDAFEGLLGRADSLALKWPNDVLLTGGKVAGILLESLTPRHLAIGVGVNLVAAPDPGQLEPGATAPVSLMGVSGLRVEPEAFLDVLAKAFAAQEERFVTYGFGPVRNAWLANAARLGETIVARTGTTEIIGVFETVDEQGQLVLKTTKGRVAIPAADVFF